MRTRNNIDSNWKFKLINDDHALETNYEDSDWRSLDLPHDWSVEFTPDPNNPAHAGGGFFPGGLGWYRKELEIPMDIGDNHILIEFDGVYMNSEVWCNGRFCGVRPYGYSSFSYDITEHVKAGEKAVIAVRVDNSRQKNSRWYTGSGIYRHVWLTIASPIRVDHWGTSVTTPIVSKGSARVECEVKIINNNYENVSVTVENIVLKSDGNEVCKESLLLGVNASTTTPCEMSMTIPSPSLWSPDSPSMYKLKTIISQDGNIIDEYETPFGVRSIRYDANEGFFLNDVNMKMMGVNEHHDAGCLGAAVPDDVIRRRFKILKEMGCNAIRVSHNPASPIFLDLCDEMGFFVIEEAFDEWKEGKTPFGYQLFWDEWWERDLKDMIDRDRNHPSIVMWSVGNEIIEVRSGLKKGLPIMKALQEKCHEFDPTRPMTCGCCAIRETNKGGYGPYMDIVGYNGGGGSCFDYEKDHATYPERIMYASEVPHSLQTRGVYRTKTWYRDLARNPNTERLDVPHYTEEEVFEDFDEHYQSSYDNAMVRISAIDSWKLTKTLPYFFGEFRWTGFDYIGECYSWPAKSWNFGILDLCGFPKDTFYFYQSQWTSKPMVHILPHWSWPGLEGKVIPVVAYSNCEKVELFQDGKSLGVKTMGEDMQLKWDVAYAAGEIKAIGINGKSTVSECSHKTASTVKTTRLKFCESSLLANGSSIAHLEVEIIDANGTFTPLAQNELQFEVSGPGKLIGLENGDPIDTTNYKINKRKAFNGMALAVIQAGKESGVIKVCVSGEGLELCEIEINVE